MDISATVTSKGQITIPAEVRRALGLRPGDRVIFRLANGRTMLHTESESQRHASDAELCKIPDIFELAGTIPTPPELLDKPWEEVRAEAWIAEALGEE